MQQEAIDDVASPAVGRLTFAAPVSALLAAALLATGAYAGRGALAATLICAGLVLAWSWPVLLDLPRPPGTTAVLAVCAAAVGIVEVTAPRENGLGWLPVALAVSLLVIFLHELLRTDGRPALVRSIAGAMLAVGLFGSGAFAVNSMVEFNGELVVAVAAAGAAVSVLADWLLQSRDSLTEWSLALALVISGTGAFALSRAQNTAWNVLVIAAIASVGVAYALRRILSGLSMADSPVGSLAIGVAAVVATAFVPYAALWVYLR